MSNARLPRLAGLLLAGLAMPAVADADSGATGRYSAYADVVEVSPRYGWREVSEPVRECVLVDRHVTHHGAYPSYDHHSRRHDGGGAAAGIVGGLIGGLIGNQFGGGNGRTAFTVAGAALGASIARDHVRRGREHRYYESGYHEAGYREVPGRTVRRCTETWEHREVRDIDGYDVTYRYQGRTFQKWMDRHPGDTVRVDVVVEPLVSGR